MQHQLMGYDRGVTMFSPDGRLLQVEYAKKTVKQGSTAMGMVCKDGVILLTDKRILDPLIVTDGVEKIFQVDDHIGATAAGILSDARILIERAQVKAQQHRVTYDGPIETLNVVRDVCNLKQLCTQSGGLRPFGVSLLIAGVDEDGARLYETDPTGIFFQYKATVIGEAETEVEEVLHKEYKESLTIEDGLKLSIKALMKVLDKDFNIERLDCAIIRNDNKVFTKLDKSKLEDIYKQIK